MADLNKANAAEREAIKLARSMDDERLRRVMGDVMSCWTPAQLRCHGAATFVLARRKALASEPTRDEERAG